MPAEVEVVEIEVVEQILAASDVVPLIFAGMYAFTNIIIWTDNNANLPTAVLPRVTTLLGKTVPVEALTIVNSTDSFDLAYSTVINKDKTLIFCIGDNECTNALISNETMESLGSESYHIRTRKDEHQATILAVNGRNSYEEGNRTINSMKIQPVWATETVVLLTESTQPLKNSDSRSCTHSLHQFHLLLV
ncbi:hypothetical protein BCR33DRAFT_579322 [Rhizoclosmatium globosum]|uniref:Uncharacterized protein n=1 Tax=Rhizoclosmatium globosum TaxID=329046 RepID=A0A1Y2B5C0_9FUNG|nr:hypothetical protein BCR33DRAFT_579322 [Rhizoclosmatium globosum]|eukprot:ORY29295.1 hypothetical protein BCR33DRAFT_579322 [Rhizoclosmatium globosum]